MAKKTRALPLPVRVQLQTLKDNAKRLLKEVQAGKAVALKRVEPYFDANDTFSLQRAQLVVARMHGFASWRRLKAFVELRNQLEELAPEQSLDPQRQCSFCTKQMQEVSKLIGGPVASICNECVELCVDILKDADAWPNPES